MSREENIKIFKDTEFFVRSNGMLQESLKHSIEKQKVILEKEKIQVPVKERYQEDAKVVVSKKRTLQAASGYKDEKVAVLNFASSSHPGGGVVRGARAQEEAICRVSTLFFALDTQENWDGFYGPHQKHRNPLHTDDIIYTPAVAVFKTDSSSPILMSEEDWYKVDVITCAAPNLRNYKAMINDNELLLLHEKRLRRILDVAITQKAETIILGAFGCGAFANNPDVVALAAKNVLREYRKAFKTIEFAVYCTPRDERNYHIFNRTLSTLA